MLPVPPCPNIYGIGRFLHHTWQSKIEVNHAIPQPRKENIKYQIEHEEALKSQPLELTIAKALNSHHAPSLADLASNSM
jgi:hypothetical protein